MTDTNEDLDESRRYLHSQARSNHIHLQKNINNNERREVSAEEMSSCVGIGKNQHQVNAMLSQRHQQHKQQQPRRISPTDHMQQRLPDNDKDISSPSAPIGLGLDANMSGLQAAATKTALLINGKVVRKPLQHDSVITTEEFDDDEKYLHNFQKHVGFSDLEGREIHHHDLISPQPIGDAVNGFHQADDNDNIPKQVQRFSSAIPDRQLQATMGTNSCSKSELAQQLNDLRRQRLHIERSIFPAIEKNLMEWYHYSSSSHFSYINALSTLDEVAARRNWTDEEVRLTSKCHVLSDVFLIWHRGPFATINGFRLGKSALTMAGKMRQYDDNDKERPDNGRGSSLFSWISSDNAEPATAKGSKVTRTNSTNPTTTLNKILIPWNEINSALGQILLLLYTIQNLPQSSITFQKHVLLPCGNASKIGIVKAQTSHEQTKFASPAATDNDSTSNDLQQAPLKSSPSRHASDITWYNLHHYEESGSILSIGYYARRNFNTALECLLYCIAEAFRVVEKRDMALASPYTMIVGGLCVGKDIYLNDEGVPNAASHCEASCGGLPIAYDPSKGEDWTKVCKYLLTNLKWLVAYIAKHEDR